MKTRTTAEERQKLREMEAAATPGPWTVYGGANTEEPYSALFSITELDKRLERDDLGEDYEIGDEAQPDAALIATTRNALPALLADLEEALAEVARQAAVIERVRGMAYKTKNEWGDAILAALDETEAERG